MPVPTAQKIRFGVFELDRQTAELLKNGTKLKLQGQPIAVLALLLEHPGELITREGIRRHLWPQDTFVDFEHSRNTHIKKLRQVFDDDTETPRSCRRFCISMSPSIAAAPSSRRLMRC